MAKLFGFPIPNPMPGTTLGLVAGVIEFVGALLLLVGLYTRPAAFVLSGQMAVAYWMAHAPGSVYPIVNQGELAIMFCFTFLYIAFAGPGRWSLDARTGTGRRGARVR